jgi:hypothetical protein
MSNYRFISVFTLFKFLVFIFLFFLHFYLFQRLWLWLIFYIGTIYKIDNFFSKTSFEDIYKIVSQHNEVASDGHASGHKKTDVKSIELNNNDSNTNVKKDKCACN